MYNRASWRKLWRENRFAPENKRENNYTYQIILTTLKLKKYPRKIGHGALG